MSGGEGSRWPEATGEGQWETVKIDLKSGLNIISWKSIGISLSSTKPPPPILIKTVEIMGLSYTSECTKCRPGTFAKDQGSFECTQCSANTFSKDGASQCTNCDASTLYSHPGATECTKREPCSKNDYYMTHTACNEKNQTTKTYKWIEPRICRVDISGAAQLPANGQVEACPPCNPGMSIFNHTTCNFCPTNQFSDGTAVCRPCPPSTAPVYGMDFKWWNQMPPNMDSSCLSWSGSGCSENKGWVLAGDSIHSSLGQADDAYLILQLSVEGFDGEEGFVDGKAIELGELSFVFSLECTADCGLFLLEERGPENKSPVIETWEKSQEKQEYRLAITKNGPRTFTWAFQKADMDQGYDDTPSNIYRTDMAKIYSIKLTNTMNGGAAMCKKCPKGSNQKGCIPCEPGMYIANNTENTCTKCPENTYLRANNAYGRESCISCGPNLYSNKEKTKCHSTCHIHSNTKHFQLTKLAGYHTLQTGASFTAKGSRFYHSFNFTLCGDDKAAAACVSNVSTYSQDTPDVIENAHNRRKDADDYSPPVKSLVCQSTLIPSPNGPSETISAQPMSLGDTLLGITTDKSLGNLNATIFKPDVEDVPDLHFYFHSGSVTQACPKGRSTVIYLRCDPGEKGNGTFKLPESCPAGTCDGCTFHILWRTQYGCAVCTPNDYTEIKEQCNKNGKQKIHYVWKTPKMCMFGEKLPKETIGRCPVIPWWAQIPMYAQIAIAVFVGCVGLMIAMVVYFWKRNRKLEYKYQKLVAGASGELPAAETCAITEGEEEDDVIFEDGKKKGMSLFSKFKSKPIDMDMDKNGLLLSDDDEFQETIELSPTHKQPLTNI
ncbi:endosome/lysosome-associated apoptosis and autophagy regulator family member 2-like isoform X4 [Amphiura filiformis]